MLVIVVVLTVAFLSCHKNGTNPTTEIPTTLRVTDSIRVDFPAGSISSPDVSIKKVTDPDIENIFNETADLFSVQQTLPYQIVLNVGKTAPAGDSIQLTISVPAASASSKKNGVQLFAQVYQDGGMEILDLFDLLPSAFNSDSGWLTAYIPAYAFTNQRKADSTYEAIFMVATTPGSNLLPAGPLVNSFAPGTPAPGGCLAGQVRCPVGSLDVCTKVAGDGFGMRRDPFTGKQQKHWCIDFKLPVGTPVYAAAGGRVEKVWTQTEHGKVIGYGLYVVIRHVDGAASLYGHLSAVSVKGGDAIAEHAQLGQSGNVGKSTGPHLHFEYVPNGVIVRSKGRIDPFPCISDGNGKGSITIRDNGNIADDAFELYFNDNLVGRTDIGQSNSVALSNLRTGSQTLKLVCIVAPDDIGTYEVLLNDGITFSDGSSEVSGVLPQVVTYPGR